MERLLIVTGASSGIGAGIAASAQEDGTGVVSVSRREGPGVFLRADLADPGSWPEVITWFGEQIDDSGAGWVGLAHCAATLTPIGPAGGVDLEDYTDNVLLNSAAPQVLGAGFIHLLADRGLSGTLLQISSGAATNPYPGWTSYCAAKAAIDQWTRAAGLESHGRVKVISVAPGVVETQMQAEIRSTAKDRFPEVDRFHRLHDEGQLADPAEVGARLWQLMISENLESGMVADLREL